MLYVLGGTTIAGMSYYMGLPKEQKEKVLKQAKNMFKQDKNFMDELV